MASGNTSRMSEKKKVRNSERIYHGQFGIKAPLDASVISFLFWGEGSFILEKVGVFFSFIKAGWRDGLPP